MTALRARLALWRRIWLMAVLGERPAIILSGAAALLIVAAIGAWVGLADDLDPVRKACRFGGTPLAAIAVTWWVSFCGGAARQNSPANASLVPGLNRAVRECAALVWVLTMFALLPVVWGHPDGAAVYPQFALALTGLGLYRAGRNDGLMVLGAIMLLYVFGLEAPALTMFLVHPAGVAIASLLAIGYAAWALPRALPVGGEGHWDLLRKQRLVRAQNDLVEWQKAKHGRGRRLRLHAWVLARDIRDGANPADMLLHGLGPGNHRYHVVAGMASVAGLFLVARAGLALLGIPVANLIGMAGTLTAVCVVSILSMNWARYGFSIRSTPGEQAVLRLAPAMPAAPSLNRVLGRRIVVICLCEWFVATALVIGMVWLWGGTGKNMRVALVMAFAILGGIGTSLDDFAHKPKMNNWKEGLWVLLYLLVLMVGIVHVDDLAQLSTVLALQLATSLAYIAMRWRRMQRGPVACPAGRMG